ncbi:glycosyltransferase [bacterium]|nr:glycosyltransferase [bacterium]
MTVLAASLSVLVPTYNAVGQVELLLRQLSALQKQHGERLRIVVCDDASSDGTASHIEREFPAIRVVRSEYNGGFGANVMRGAMGLETQYLALLNSDVELMGDPFAALLGVLRENRDVFAVMPLIYNTGRAVVENFARLYAKRGLVWHMDTGLSAEWTSLLQELLEQPLHPDQRLADIAAGRPAIPSLLCGAAFVCETRRFLELGGFDPRYRPFYWEDVDLDYKARARGWHCAVVPQCCMLHRHSETIDKHHGQGKIRHLRMNQLRFVLAHRRQLEQGPEALRSPRFWWLLRGLREALGGDALLRQAYLRAAGGAESI